MNILPVLKCGRHSKSSSHGPVTCLLIHSKVMESLIYNDLRDHLSFINLFSPQQHSVQPTWWRRWANGQSSLIVSGTLISYNFDGVNHMYLINKLKRFVIESLLNEWLTSHISSRLFRVNVNFTFSRARGCPGAILQDSVLETRHFLIYKIWPSSVSAVWFVTLFDDMKLRKDHWNEGYKLALQEDIISLQR